MLLHARRRKLASVTEASDRLKNQQNAVSGFLLFLCDSSDRRERARDKAFDFAFPIIP
jgi:hypothetical protein